MINFLETPGLGLDELDGEVDELTDDVNEENALDEEVPVDGRLAQVELLVPLLGSVSISFLFRELESMIDASLLNMDNDSMK